MASNSVAIVVLLFTGRVQMMNHRGTQTRLLHPINLDKAKSRMILSDHSAMLAKIILKLVAPRLTADTTVSL